MKSKIAILLLPFLMVFTFFKENLMKSKIAMFNLNRKSTFRSTLPALMLALITRGGRLLGQPGLGSRTRIRWDAYSDGRAGAVPANIVGPR